MNALQIGYDVEAIVLNDIKKMAREMQLVHETKREEFSTLLNLIYNAHVNPKATWRERGKMLSKVKVGEVQMILRSAEDTLNATSARLYKLCKVLEHRVNELEWCAKSQAVEIVQSQKKKV